MQEFAIDCSGVNAKYMVVSEKTEDVRNNSKLNTLLNTSTEMV